MPDRVRGLLAVPVACAALLAGCGADEPRLPPPGASEPAGQSPDAQSADARFPDVVDAVLVPEEGGAFTVEVTISSPYDTPERYADAWRVLAGDRVLAVRELTHDHAGEQPFTRSLGGVEVPDGVTRVTVEGRDLRNGYGGATVTVDVPGR